MARTRCEGETSRAWASSRRLAGALAAALLLGAPPSSYAADEDPGAPLAWPPAPLGWQEPSPVARLFLQLPFEPPEPLPRGRFRVGERLLYSNSIMAGRRPGLTLLTDVETAQPTLAVAAGLGGGVELGAALPAVVDWNGFLDRPIEGVDAAFDAVNPDRLGRPRDRAAWTLRRDDGRGVSRSGAGAGLGDAWVGLKARVVAGAGVVPSLSARLALSLPTGRLPWGAGALVPAAGVLAGWRLGPVALRLTADLAVPTARLRTVELPTRPYGAIQVGLAFPATPAIALHAQASVHTSPLHGTGLAELDHPTAYVLLGLTARLGSALLDVGVAENVFSPYRGADLTFLVGVHGR